MNNTYFFGFDRSVNPIGNGVIIAGMLSFILFCVFASTLFIHLYMTIKKLSPVLSETTRHLQLMLFKVLFLQAVALLIFIILPASIIIIVIILQLNWAYSLYIFDFLILLVESHACVDYFILLYFTKPYRRFCIYWLKKLFRKKETMTVNVVPIILKK